MLVYINIDVLIKNDANLKNRIHQTSMFLNSLAHTEIIFINIILSMGTMAGTHMIWFWEMKSTDENTAG